MPAQKKIAAKHRLCFASPLGTICLEDDGEAVTALHFQNREPERGDAPSDLLKQAQTEITEYFQGIRKSFDVPIHLSGTEFQCRVWNALRQIPYGTTCCYAEVAAAIGMPKACRAVGGANNKNPLMILVPCHRVIGKSGGLVGFGAGLDVKQALLRIESEHSAT